MRGAQIQSAGLPRWLHFVMMLININIIYIMGMLAIIRCRIFCLPVCYPKIKD